MRNLLEARRFSTGNIQTSSGTLHGGWSAQEGVIYIEDVVADYRKYAGVDSFGGRVAEVGPGDNCGVALLLLANGCEQVDLADRYYSMRDPSQQAEIYRLLAERHPGVRKLLECADLLDEETFPRLKRYYGKEAAAEEFFFGHRNYDLIISRAVGEHLYDPCQAIKTMAEALRAGGVLLHKIDLRDHEMFSTFHDELKWLEVPDTVYRWMTAASGRPNRVLTHEYRRALETAGVDFRILVTRLAGVGDITPHLLYDDIEPGLRHRAEQFVESRRGRFASSLRSVPTRDLATAGIFIVARKPA